MKLSIENFKSIEKVVDFDLKSMSILSGANSSGKSSLIQLLLIIKQTILESSSKNILKLDGDYYSSRNPRDLFHNHDEQNEILFSTKIKPTETHVSLPNIGWKINEIIFSSTFSLVKEKIVLTSFHVELDTDDDSKKYFLKLKRNPEGQYAISADSELYGKGLMYAEVISYVEFIGFIPQTYTVTDEKIGFKLDWFVEMLTNTFEEIYYIAPNRELPKESYIIKESHSFVGSYGEFTSQILKNKATDNINFPVLVEDNGITSHQIKQGTLLDAVEYWICNKFNFSVKIQSEQQDENYRIFLTDSDNNRINIKHVGFGVSQVLPIIVQGLTMPEKSLIIVEQPEVHLHPKVQSYLYDFLFGLTLLDKKVLVETHSSHFITRMRRRVAEDNSNVMDNIISLTFIEDNIYKVLQIDDYGTLDYYPDDFIESQDSELSSIIKAQMKKRKNKSK